MLKKHYRSSNSGRRLRNAYEVNRARLSGEFLEVRDLLSIATSTFPRVEGLTMVADPVQPDLKILRFELAQIGDRVLHLFAWEGPVAQVGYWFQGGQAQGSGVEFQELSRVEVDAGGGDFTVKLQRAAHWSPMAALFGGIEFVNAGPGDRIEVIGDDHDQTFRFDAQADTIAITQHRTGMTEPIVHAPGIGQVAFYGLGGSDRLQVTTGSGFADRVRVDEARVDIERGPMPSQSGRELVWYSGIEELIVSTAGGNDTVTVTQFADGRLPATTTILGQDEDDLIQVNLAAGALIQSLRVDGNDGSDQLVVSTQSGHADLVRITPASISVQYGPQPASAPVQEIAYDAFEDVMIRTAGGADTITVDQVSDGFVPWTTRVAGEDENDSVEVNLRRAWNTSYVEIDGGEGDANGLTIFHRAGINESAEVLPDRAVFSQPVTVMKDPPKIVTYRNLRGVTVHAGDIRVRDVAEQSFPALVSLVGIFMKAELSNPQVGSTFSFRRPEGSWGVNNPTTLDIRLLSGYDDLLDMDGDTLKVQLGPLPEQSPVRTILFDQIGTLDIRTAGGADRVTISDSRGNLHAKATTIHGEDEDDQFQIRTLDGSLGTLQLRGGQGGADSLVVRPLGEQGVKYAIRNAGNASGISIDEIEKLRLMGGVGRDEISNATIVPAIIDGGPGDDMLWSGDAADSLFGGAGEDELYGRGGNDWLAADHNYLGELFASDYDYVDGGDGEDVMQVVGVDGINQAREGDRVTNSPRLFAFDDFNSLLLGAGGFPGRSTLVTRNTGDGVVLESFEFPTDKGPARPWTLVSTFIFSQPEYEIGSVVFLTAESDD